MGSGYQAREAKGTRSDKLRPGKCRHTVTMAVTLFDTVRDAALANNRSISEEIVARIDRSFKSEGLPGG